MKKTKKFIVLALALAMIVSLSACGSFETSIMKGAKKMQELESLHMDMMMDVGLNISVMGQGMPIDLKVTNSADVQTSPQKMLMEIGADIMGEKQTMHLYVEQDGDKFLAASSYDGVDWESEETMEMEADVIAEKVDPKAGIALLAKYASNFEKVSSENVLGYDTIRYDGVITSEDLMELVDLLSVAQLAGTGVDLSEEELAQIKEALKGPYSVPCSIWLEGKSGMIIRYDIDLTEMVGAIIEPMLAQEIAGTEAEELGMKIDVGNMKLSISFSQFDAIDEIQRPEF